HFLAFKLDASGNQQWGKYLFTGVGVCGVSDIQQTSDNGYIAAGSDFTTSTDSIGNHGIRDFMVTKLNNSGTPQWIKCLGGTNNEEASSIQQTSDGGYIVAGYTGSNDVQVSGLHAYLDYWVVKLDGSGNISWQKVLGGGNYDYATSVIQTSDGGYIVAGYSGSKDGDVTGTHWGGSDNDVWVVKLNASGAITWQKSYGGSGDDQCNSIQQTSDGGYIIAGTTTSNDGNVTGKHGTSYSNNDYWVIKIDNTGNLSWQKCLGGTGSGTGAGSGNDIAYSVKQTTDGGYVVSGTVSSGTATNDDITGYHGNTGSDYWIVKLDNTGNISWQKCLGGTGTEDARTIVQTADGGYIVTGTTVYSPNGDVNTMAYSDNHPWTVKLKDGFAGIEEEGILNGIDLSPNPAQQLVTVSNLPLDASLRISDLTGNLIYSNDHVKASETLNVERFANGVYFVQVKSHLHTAIRKLVVAK
ncbi:MAG: T9SS type A sorting domain-containing protein, partial [Bacteroidetes bacterium]|nr:T9SS type A sorting domain-containing protein [Bacteroidota bacterium]